MRQRFTPLAAAELQIAARLARRAARAAAVKGRAQIDPNRGLLAVVAIGVAEVGVVAVVPGHQGFLEQGFGGVFKQ
jgi:hypothetical protein